MQCHATAGRPGASLAISTALHAAVLAWLAFGAARASVSPEEHVVRVQLIAARELADDHGVGGAPAEFAPAVRDPVAIAARRLPPGPSPREVRVSAVKRSLPARRQPAERAPEREAVRESIVSSESPAVTALPDRDESPTTNLEVPGSESRVAGDVARGPGVRADRSGSVDVAGRGGASGDSSMADAYVEEVRRRIAHAKRYPAAVKRRGIEGTVHVVISIGGDGTLVDLVLEEGANEWLGRSTLEAVEAAAPFAPPPHGVRRIRVPVRYALR